MAPSDRGATMVEYAVIVMVITLGAILLVAAFGQQVLGLFDGVAGF